MKRNLLFLTLTVLPNTSCFPQKHNSEISKYITVLQAQTQTAKEYILNLFENHDIVVLCERNHGEMTQYTLIYDIINSVYFQKNVGNIFTEIGAVDNRTNVLNFVHTKFKNEDEKFKAQLSIYRNMSFGIWEKTNFFNFIGDLNTLNTTLDKNKRINLFVSNNRNPNQEEISSTENFKKYFNLNWGYGRDSIMALNIITTFDSIQLHTERKKALIIMNFRHAFSKSLTPDGYINTGEYLKIKYKDRFANVLINGTALLPEIDKNSLEKPKAFQSMSETLIQKGKWDASFKILGIENIGFNFLNTSFGKDNFDKWPYENDYTYQDVFTGYVFYLPIEKHWDSFGIKNITKGHEEEIYKQDSLLMKTLHANPNPKENISKMSTIEIKKYQDLEQLLIMREQWEE